MNWLHWRPSETTRHQYKLTRLIKQLWLQHREYGYVRVAKRLRKTFKCHISNRTIWLSMHGLGIQSPMSHYRPKKPRTATETPPKPNPMRSLTDRSGVVTTDITYIQLTSKKWVYVATAYDPEHRKVLAFQVAEHITAELAVGPIKQLIDQQ